MQEKRDLFLFITIGALVMGILFITYGYERTWALWNLPVMSPHFADLRSITGGAASSAMGLDPMYENPGDPWGRLMNYPRIWQVLFKLGITESHTTGLGILFILLFLVGLFLFVEVIDGKNALVLTLCVFSPAVLLGMERANNDLLIFFILAVALATVSRWPNVSMLVTVLAVVLKLFPLFGSFYLLDAQKERSCKRIAVIAGLSILYIGLTWGDIQQLQQATQRSVNLAYSISILGIFIGNLFHLPVVKYALVALSYGLALLFGIYALDQTNRQDVTRFFLQSEPENRETTPTIRQGSQRDLAAFRMGAGIYMGTFLLRSNFDYRLMFLLFTIPQLLWWRHHLSGRMRWITWATIAGILVSLWSLLLFSPLGPSAGLRNLATVLDECANWVAFAGLTYLSFASAPHWSKDLYMRYMAPGWRRFINPDTGILDQ